MPFCTQCGARLEDGAKFCTVCGARQPEAPAAPAAEQREAPAARPAVQYDPTIYSAGQQTVEKKKSGAGKLIGVVLAVLAVIAALVYVFAGKSGGAGVERESDLGLYTARKAELNGISIGIDKMWENGFSIELQSRGKCRVNVDGEKGSAKWSAEEDGSFRIHGSGIDCGGMLKDGVLVLENVMDSGIELTFTKDGVLLPEPEKPSAKPEAAADDELLGLYYAQKGEAMGIEVSIEDIWENGLSIELLADGKCHFNFNGKVSTTGWELDGEDFRLLDGTGMQGKLKDGVLTLEDIGGVGVTIYFVKEGASVQGATDDETPSAEYSAWAGDYYGYWTVTAVNGKFADNDAYLNGYWDTCATISVKGGRGEIRIWDEDGDEVAEAGLRFAPGLTDKGCATTTDGYFYTSDLSGGVWLIEPGEGMFRDYEGFLVISGRYAEPEGSDDWLDYYIFLRPWGMDWEDVETGDMSEMIYSDMMPRHYHDWYLPLIEAGRAMPDDFEGLDQEG